VLENILLPKALRDGKKIEVKSIADLTDVDIASKLETLGIAHLVNEMPAELSGGELKRAAILRALVNKPEIVIADEPTSNLDETNAKIVFELLAELAQSGTSVLVATHDPRGFKYGDRVYTMHKGHLLPSGESDFGGL
jgi:putative ABC transport system ATP-binding protein